ncbi:TnsA endonuclease N-terminal domain-containing protein [Pseudoduganella danionis]|uniref:TnsA endonuclease N-terminal domain-containing protein n=1 Tax=Pseudoduganella danionis TaxID=1890295 RepID=A0ABW9SQA2_9BURK|nr:TnsA endonuclease N-terminal domain-containing protein [Pseudoduganella danionis]MTW34261.1 hypothetical protein [Pseudoduganella danionis]
MLPNIVDVREQVPLNLEEHTAQVAAYSAKHQHQTARGTLACAEMLGFKHPVLRSSGETAPWVMTTDFVVTLEAGAGQYELLAISVKPDNDLVVTLDEVDFLRFADHLDTSVFLTSKFRQYLSKGGKRSRESRR